MPWLIRVFGAGHGRTYKLASYNFLEDRVSNPSLPARLLDRFRHDFVALAGTDWKALSSLEAGELQTQLLDHANEAMNGLDAEQEAETLPTLPEPMRVIWVLSSLSLEVMMGSFLAYFMNSAGRHSAAAIAALNEIGATRMATVLERAARSVELHREAWDSRTAEMNETADVYDVVTPYEDLPNADELSDLTDEFREAEDQDNWGDLLDAYLKRSVERLANTEST